MLVSLRVCRLKLQCRDGAIVHVSFVNVIPSSEAYKDF